MDGSPVAGRARLGRHPGRVHGGRSKSSPAGSGPGLRRGSGVPLRTTTPTATPSRGERGGADRPVDTPAPGSSPRGQGRPATVLVDASRGADLLALGSRGHGTVSGALLGSVAEHCAAHAHCPVLVSGTGTDRWPERRGRPHRRARRSATAAPMPSSTSTSRWPPGEVVGFLGPNGAGKTTDHPAAARSHPADLGLGRALRPRLRRDVVATHRRLAYVAGEASLWPGAHRRGDAPPAGPGPGPGGHGLPRRAGRPLRPRPVQEGAGLLQGQPPEGRRSSPP